MPELPGEETAYWTPFFFLLHLYIYVHKILRLQNTGKQTIISLKDVNNHYQSQNLQISPTTFQ
jgi:hypothetical protein